MVVSRKSKLCVFSLILLVVFGVTLAVLSTLGFFQTKENGDHATAEKYSYQNAPGQLVNVSCSVSCRLWLKKKAFGF